MPATRRAIPAHALVNTVQPNASADSGGQIPYAELSYLIVEDSPMMSAWLRSAIAQAGGRKID